VFEPKPLKISLLTPCVSFSPPKNLILSPKVQFSFTELFFEGINMCFQPFKSDELFLKGINGNSGGEKEKQGVGREIFFHPGFSA
jgi:hypothetical protein